VNEYINNAGEKLFAWFCGVIGVILFHSSYFVLLTMNISCFDVFKTWKI